MYKITLQKPARLSSNIRMLFFAIISIVGFQNLHAQLQIGSDIQGLAASDHLGYSSKITDSGDMVIVGATGSGVAGSSSGQVRVFKLTGGVWTQFGQSLNGSASNQQLGWDVDMASDGVFIATSAPFANATRGYVRVYGIAGGLWTQFGPDITGEADGDASGVSIGLNGFGNIIAIGAPYNDGNGNNSGHVRVYQYMAGVWTQIGADIDGEAAGDNFGWSVALNDLGDRLVVGAPKNAGGGSSRGHVRIFDLVAGNWVQHGSDIDGIIDDDNLGHAVAIDNAGNTIVVGGNLGFGNGGNLQNSGIVRVYDISGPITQIGSQIQGNSQYDYMGSEVSISNDGTRIAASAIGNDDNGDTAGQVRAYKNVGGVWTQIGANINGAAASDTAGLGLGLSGDGQSVVIGSPYNSGSFPNAGHARVFALESPPTAICKNITVQLDGTGNASITAAAVDNGSSDPDGPVTLSVSPSTFNCNDIGTPVAVTLTVTDSAGQTATCTANVTVEDNIAPVAGCQNTTIQLPASGTYTLSIGEVELNSTDNCGVVNATLSQTTFNCANIGPNNVILTVFDGAGNSSTCTSVVTVQDVIAPVITCVANAIKNQEASGQCYYTVQGTEFDPTATDNCSSVTLSNSINGAATLAGAQLPIGPNNITWTATDGSGNQSTCSFLVIVQDNQPPVINCVPDATRNTDTGSCTYTVQGNEFNATVTQACSNVTLTNDFNGTATLSGAVLPIGTTTITWTAVDASSYSSTCTTTITVLDNIAPTVTCQNYTLELGSNGTGILLSYDLIASESDNCTINLSHSLSQGLFDCSNIGTNQVILTTSDNNGNSTTCTATVTVVDNTPPVITCVANTTVNVTAGTCTYTVQGTEFDATATDNCSLAGVVNNVTNSSSLAGAVLNLGINTIQWQAGDNNGNTSLCSMTITVHDNINPTINCVANATRNVAAGTCTYTVQGNEFNATATDNCSLVGIVNNVTNTSSMAGAVLNIGSNVVQWVAGDDSGNTAMCTMTITVLDNINPTINCVANTTRNVTAGTCTYTVQGTEFDATATDNCSLAGVVNNVTNSDSLAGAVLNIGPNVVQWVAGDNSGNTAMCTMTITVLDNIDPIVTCPSDQTVQVPAGNTYSLPDYVTNGMVTVTDNCSSGLGLITQQSPVPGTNLAIGTYTISFTSQDDGGNTATCSFQLTVDEILSRPDFDNINSIMIFPNPADDIVTIKNDNLIPLNNAVLYDMRGRVIKTIELSNTSQTNSLDVSNLASDTYFLIINGENGTKHFKLVII